MLGQKCTY